MTDHLATLGKAMRDAQRKYREGQIDNGRNWNAMCAAEAAFDKALATPPADNAALMCVACGATWDGNTCGQKDNGWPFPVCSPSASPNRTENNATRLLRQSYITLAFAFNRLHQSSRSRDGELCLDFQKVRSQIEDHFRSIGVKL
jgi:hypothetical protein